METIITAATVMAMYFNVAKTNVGNYYYNADVENGKVVSINVYDDFNKNLSQKLQYRFTYDDENRLSSREALKWNSRTQRWENYYALDYAYTDQGYTLSRREWDGKKNVYGEVDEKMVYENISGEVMALNCYKKSEKGGMKLAYNMLVMHPQGDMLLADICK